jgi:hypothetical protein
MNFPGHAVVAKMAILSCLAAVAGCGVSLGPSLQGSGIEKMETRAVGGFTEIEVGHAIELQVTIGPAADLVVTADDNLLPKLRTEVSGDRLSIYCDQNYTSRLGVKVLATVPDLNAIVGSGAARIEAADIKSPKFLLDLSGASHCELTGDIESMEVKLSGASQATLTGSGNELKVESSGASRLSARQYVANNVNAELSGASTAEVHVKADLKVEASGASTLRYLGGPPQMNAYTTGASTVVKE